MDKLVKQVSKTVQVLVKCSSSDADIAAEKICQNEEALWLLAIACGVTVSMANHGRIATMASLAVQSWPTVALGAAFTLANGYAAKRFCTAVVKQTGNKISNFDLLILRDLK